MYGYYRKKLHANNFWELRGEWYITQYWQSSVKNAYRGENKIYIVDSTSWKFI